MGRWREKSGSEQLCGPMSVLWHSKLFGLVVRWEIKTEMSTDSKWGKIEVLINKRKLHPVPFCSESGFFLDRPTFELAGMRGWITEKLSMILLLLWLNALSFYETYRFDDRGLKLGHWIRYFKIQPAKNNFFPYANKFRVDGLWTKRGHRAYWIKLCA